MYDKNNDVERILNEDSRDKKRTGTGVFSRASRLGYIRGGVRTQSDFLTTKEKKKLNGEVRTKNMYENYKTLENCNLNEILAKSENEIKYILALIKKSFTSTKVSKQFGISVGKLYYIYTKYGVYTPEEPKFDIKKFEGVLIDKSILQGFSSIEKGKYFQQLTNDGYKNIEISKYYGLTVNIVNNYKARYKQNIKKNGENSKIQDIKVIENKDITMDHNELKELKEQIYRLQQENLELNKDVKSLLTQKHNGLNLNFIGEYDKEELSNRLLSIDNITLPEKRYKIELSLIEVL